MASVKRTKEDEKMLDRFIRSLPKERGRLFIGIDPGSQGAIAFQMGEQYVVVSIPVLKVSRGKKNKTVFNEPAILEIFKRIRKNTKGVSKHAMIEEAQMFGKGGTYVAFRTGSSFAMWPLFLMGMGYSVESVRPNIWKKQMGLHKQDKEASRHKALGLFPKAKITNKSDHDRAEALLLSEHLRRGMNR